MAAIGQATKHGVIIKYGEALENMGKATTIAFDKTGTLTYGKLEVTDVIPMDGRSETDLLVLAASAEHRSEHPLDKAIAARANSLRLILKEVTTFKMNAGKGICAVIDDSFFLHIHIRT